MCRPTWLVATVASLFLGGNCPDLGDFGLAFNENPTTSISVDPDSVVLGVGSSVRFRVSFRDSNGSVTFPLVGVSWFVRDTSVVKLNSSSRGNANIEAKSVRYDACRSLYPEQRSPQGLGDCHCAVDFLCWVLIPMVHARPTITRFAPAGLNNPGTKSTHRMFIHGGYQTNGFDGGPVSGKATKIPVKPSPAPVSSNRWASSRGHRFAPLS